MNKTRPLENREKPGENWIRDANFDDVEAIARINTECWKNNYRWIIADEYLESIDREERTKKWKEHFKKWETHYLVKKIDGKVVWFIDGRKNREKKEVPYDFEIMWLYVDKEYQGKKIGTELVEALLSHDIFKNDTSFFLFTLKDNPQSRGFYEKLWGKLSDYEVVKEYWGKPYTLVCYYRKK